LWQGGKALNTSVIDWQKIKDAAMAYVQKKIVDHRFDGLPKPDTQKTATFDLIESRETTS
jgi:hypothetical protein